MELKRHFETPAVNGHGIKLQRFENEIFFDLGGFDPEKSLNYVARFPFNTGDILFCAFAKCGNHWISNIVWKLKTLSDYKRPKFTVLEIGENECYDDQETPRILHTHLRPDRLPKEHIKNNGKIVLLLRNPKDACVSFFYHMKDAPIVQNQQTFDEFYECYFSGNMFMSYLDYLKEWEEVLYENRQGNSSMNIEVFYFEDFKENPKDNIVRLNNFLGFNRDQKYIEQVLEQTSFEYLKQYELINKERVNQFCVNSEGNSLIYRQGNIGDWKNHFTVAQSEKVDTLMKQTLKRGIIKFPHYE